jgi:hypothetical protein
MRRAEVAEILLQAPGTEKLLELKFLDLDSGAPAFTSQTSIMRLQR